MRRALLPVSLSLAALALLAWTIWGVFETQRADVAVARAFLTHIANADYRAAQDLMTPSLATRAGIGVLSSGFGEIEQWDRIRFSSRSTNNGGGIRRTDLLGRGITATGCESALQLSLIDGLVDAFNVSPLCPAAGVGI